MISFDAVEAFFRRVHPNAADDYVAASTPAVRAGGDITFTAHYVSLDAGGTRLGLRHLDHATGRCVGLSDAQENEWCPCWSPDGRVLASLSDRDGQVCAWLRPASVPGRRVPLPITGVESLDWAPDSRMLLLVAASDSAEQAAPGGGTQSPSPGDAPAWLPFVEPVATGPSRILYLASPDGDCRALAVDGLTIWDAGWCGRDRIVAIASSDPSENGWYDATLVLIDVASGTIIHRLAHAPTLGLPTASPDGGRVAFVSAVASDRGVVAGQLWTIDVADWRPVAIDTNGIDVSWLQWRDAEQLMFAGLRGLETVIAEQNLRTGERRLIWRSDAESCGMIAPVATPYGDRGAILFPESYSRRPELALATDRETTIWPTRAQPAASLPHACGSLEAVRWTATDGETIEGLLLRPLGPGPFPLVTELHGGPSWAMRPRWMGDIRPERLLLVTQGHAVFLPNYRGSTGRGQAFAERVRGDIGGIDADDILAGIDAVIAAGIADPARLGLMGASYGGFLACWMPTRDDRFAAAVAVAPITDWLSQHWTSNVARFDTLFGGGSPTANGALHRQRSPVLHARDSRTPTLLIAGKRDRSTPADQAREHYQALRGAGVETMLLTYPGEGHGVRTFPATIDAATRIVRWFDTHMPPHRTQPTP